MPTGRRIGVAMASHESGTFNPTPTTMVDFLAMGLRRGDEVFELEGVGGVGGFLAEAEAHANWEIVPILSALTVPGGRVDQGVIDSIGRMLSDGIAAAGELDGFVLLLHGACAGEGLDDVDGHWLHLVRRSLGSEVPLVLGLDHHANVTQRMIDGCDLLVGHRTQPHDVADTGRIAGALLAAIVEDDVAPVTSWRKIPLITHQEQFLSDRTPMSLWFERARALEREHDAVLQISVFPMQPWLDVEEAGWAVVVHTDGDQPLADRLADELADLVWALRDDLLVKDSISIPLAVARAESAAEGIVVLSDTGDSVLGGSGGDSTALLAEMIRQGFSGPALATVVEPSLRERLGNSRVGEQVTLLVGGAVSLMHDPIELVGRLVFVGPLVVPTEGFWTRSVDFGHGCAIETAVGTIVVSERRGFGGVLPAVYEHIGIDPSEFKAAIVKTASNFQFFADLSSEVLRVDTPGPTQSDLFSLPWERLPRPIYPLDSVEGWRT